MLPDIIPLLSYRLIPLYSESQSFTGYLFHSSIISGIAVFPTLQRLFLSFKKQFINVLFPTPVFPNTKTLK